MKENVLTAGKWIIAGALLLAVGFFVVTRLGHKRGTRAYRARIALWSLLLGLIGGGGALMVSGCEVEKSSCYVAMPEDAVDVQAEDKKSPDYGQPTCYAPRIDPDYIGPQPDAKPDVATPEEIMISCYEALPPDLSVQEVDVVPQEDIKPDPGFPLQDTTILCYAPRFEEVVEEDSGKDTGEPDYGQPMCYAPPFEPDLQPQEDTKEEPEVFIQCYDGLPPDNK